MSSLQLLQQITASLLVSDSHSPGGWKLTLKAPGVSPSCLFQLLVAPEFVGMSLQSLSWLLSYVSDLPLLFL